jgi:hypothetical protein
MRLFHWFARLVNRSSFLGFLCRKGAMPVAHMAPRFALDVAIWATGISPLLCFCAPQSLAIRNVFPAGKFKVLPETIRV